MKWTTAITAPTLLCALGVASLAATGTAKSAQGPKIPSEVLVLKRLVGKWQGKVAYQFGDMKGTALASIDCRGTSGGVGVRCTSRFDGMPMGPVEETDLFGYDAGEHRYHWFAVTSMGETHDHVAEVRKDGKLTWVYSGREAGKPMQEIIETDLAPNSKRMTFRTTMTVGGQQAGSLDGTVTRH